MDTREFDFSLPPELIAQTPALFPFSLAPLYASDLADHARVELFRHSLDEDMVALCLPIRRTKSPKAEFPGGCALARRFFEPMVCSCYALSHVASARGRRVPCECNWRNRPRRFWGKATW